MTQSCPIVTPLAPCPVISLYCSKTAVRSRACGSQSSALAVSVEKAAGETGADRQKEAEKGSRHSFVSAS